MKALDGALDGASRARLIGHAVGLASYEALALTGAAGDLAWFAGLQMLPALLLLELVWGACNLPARRLKRLAGKLSDTGLAGQAQVQGLSDFLKGLATRAALRSLAVWLLAGLVLWAFGGLTWIGVLLLACFGALPAALAQAGLCAAVCRKALAEGGVDAAGHWPPDLDALKPWPSLGRRFRAALFACLALVLAPLAALALLRLPLSLPFLGVLALLATLWAWAWAEELRRHVEPSLRGLAQGLRSLSKGDFDVRQAPVGADALGEAGVLLGSAAAGLERRERALKVFGPDMEPGQGAALLESLASPAQTSEVAVLSVRWLGADASLSALEPAARLGALGRFYQCAQDAVQRGKGRVLEIGGGHVLAVWGAPGVSASDPALSLAAALAAAWGLKSSLPVASSQFRLRHAASMDWSLALASGSAAAGAWGPRDQQRWALVGGPLAEVRRLSLRPGGPWLDEASAKAAPAPYQVKAGADAWELVGAQE
jgi:hypothetical protein